MTCRSIRFVRLPHRDRPTSRHPSSYGATRVVFDRQNWRAPRPVRVHGLDDWIDDYNTTSADALLLTQRTL